MPPRSIPPALSLALLALLALGLPGPVLPRSEAATNSPVLPSLIRLEEAIWRDEILGDVNGAIRGYRSLLEARDLPDRVKVETLYQLAFALALKGNPDKAVETLIRVVDDFPGLEPFAQYASQGIRLLSPDALKRGRQWQHDETIRIGDLAIALDGALSRTDAAESRAVLQELEESIEVLTGQMPTGSERSGWEARASTLGEIHRRLRDGKPGEARSAWVQADLAKTLSGRDGLFEPDDFSAWITERRDAFARALQRGDLSAMATEAEPLHRFAALLGDRIEESPARQYARFLGDALTLVETLGRQGRLQEARTQWRRTDRALDRAYGAYRLQVPGLATFPQPLRPDLVRLLSGVEATLERLDSPKPEEPPVPPLAGSLEALRRFLPSVTDAASRQRLGQWMSDFEAAHAALEAGQPARARKILQAYEF